MMWQSFRQGNVSVNMWDGVHRDTVAVLTNSMEHSPC
jgi:hypothetical protein